LKKWAHQTGYKFVVILGIKSIHFNP